MNRGRYKFLLSIVKGISGEDEMNTVKRMAKNAKVFVLERLMD